MKPVRRRSKRWLLSLPLLLLLAGGVILPLSMLVVAPRNGSVVEDLPLLVSDPFLMRIAWQTVSVSMQVTFWTMVLAVPLAFVLSTTQGWVRGVVLVVILASVWLNIIIRSYTWILMLQDQGLVYALLGRSGALSRFVPPLYSRYSVVIGMVHVLIPTAAILITVGASRVERWRSVASQVGASSSFFVLRLFLPITIPSVGVAAVLVFALSMGFYITPELLGGGQGGTMMFALLIDQQVKVTGDWGRAAALAVVLTSTVLLILLLIAVLAPLRRALTVALARSDS